MSDVPTHFSNNCYPPAACAKEQPRDSFASIWSLVDCPACLSRRMPARTAEERLAQMDLTGLDPGPGDARVVSLAERRLEPVPDVVEQLEHLLERARRGEVRGLAIAATVPSGRWTTAYVIGDTGLAPLNLAVDLLKSRLLANPTE